MRISRRIRSASVAFGGGNRGCDWAVRGFLFAALVNLGGCNGAPSRNILGSYFPSWMVCALVGIAVAGIARAIFKASGTLQELPVPFVVLLAVGCVATFTLWLVWLA
jgi:hypothetical protein